MIKELVISLRPRLWYKNFILFVGLIFSLNLFNISMLLSAFYSFVIFCFISGSGYIINDIIDRESDKKHPKNCKRPIASGRLNIISALIFAIIIVFISLGFSYLINIKFMLITFAYLFLTLLYSLFLKKIAIVDVITISIGFVLRTIAGCFAINVFVSPWLIVSSFLIALFLALGKRRYELVSLKKISRFSLNNYSVYMIDQMINVTSTALIISYSLYTFLTEHYYLMITIPISIYGIFRYLFLTYEKNIGGNPELMFKDKPMLLCILLWVIIVILILYFNKIVD